MLRKYKIIYVKVETTREKPKHHEVEIMASSKYDAKKRFYFLHTGYEIVKTEEVQE